VKLRRHPAQQAVGHPRRSRTKVKGMNLHEKKR
jgi:hypothetical protein